MDKVLGYSAIGRELERSALVGVFREWRLGWTRNLAMFRGLPQDVQDSIRAGSDDFVAATNQIMASWVFLHPDVQQRHIDFMRQLEELAERVLSQAPSSVEDVEAALDGIILHGPRRDVEAVLLGALAALHCRAHDEQLPVPPTDSDPCPRGSEPLLLN